MESSATLREYGHFQGNTHIMDNSEAQKVLREQLESFSGRSHFELTQFVEEKRVEAYGGSHRRWQDMSS